MATAAFRKHPRIRGESPTAEVAAEEVLETSPHTRGKPLKVPTGDGPDKKHPRIRGESSLGRSDRWCCQETSPHTRGKHGVPFYTAKDFGNIPAYAGKADGSLHYEHFQLETSPHTRGKHGPDNFSDYSLGNIPAYAGKATTY